MNKKAVVAGHICLDITPTFPQQASKNLHDILSPGSLTNVGPADIHTGGAVANTGLAMKILGADVTLAGKIGNDAFGDMIESITGRYGASQGLIRSAGDATSYSIVISVPGVDRIFLHDPGANDTFCAGDLPMDAVKEASLFHFGYPPIMKRIYENNGSELVSIIRTVQEAGAATSLDMCSVDPDSESGHVNWSRILSDVLPYVDIFVPSVEELMFMLDRERFEQIRRDHPDEDLTRIMNIEEDIGPLGAKCLDLGAKIVLIKCGQPGMYYCTKDERSIAQISPRLELNPEKWASKSGFEKSFVPEKILSGTGAGDTSVAAFLTAMLAGSGIEECVRYAAATGACCVTAYDALGGLKSFEKIDEMIADGWKKNE